MRGTLAERFAVKHQIDDAGCWIWTASINSAGYGLIRDGGVAQLATERNPLYNAAFIAHTIATLTADYWQACRVCGAVGDAPCRDGGRFVRRHGGRA